MNLFYRPLLNATTYNSQIQAASNTTTVLAEGDTKQSVVLMKNWTLKHYKQVKTLATTLKKGSLESTVKNIKDWLYHAIQYKKDGAAQLLRSPSRSWQDRQDGVDCKSYSIFASSLLLNLGITHYFRIIKQKSLRPDQFSHVYVIVPNNQKTGALNQGYLTIDGTIPSFVEPKYTEKYDVIMEHYGLNGTVNGLACACQEGQGLHGGDNQFDWSNVFNVVSAGTTGIFNLQSDKYKAKADEYTSQTQLEIARQKTEQAKLQSQIDLFNAQIGVKKLDVAQKGIEENARLEAEKVKLQAEKEKTKKTMVAIGVGAAVLLVLGTGAMVMNKNKKAA